MMATTSLILESLLAACFFWTLVAIFIKTNVVRYEFIKSGFRRFIQLEISKSQFEENIFSTGKKPRLISLGAFSKQQIRLDKIVDVAV
jgi:phosphoglycerate-specific signal transduction histidine kinase